MKPKRVLVIAYHFPPIGGSGTQRPAKFVKHLPHFGWQPYVITTDRPYGDDSQGYDTTLLAGIPPETPIWRVPTPQPQPVYHLARRLGWRSAALGNAPTVPAPAVEEKAPASSAAPLVRLRHALLEPLYWVHHPPVDPAFYWALRIVPLARQIIERERIDAIFTTVPPWSALLTGALLRRLTGRPWVADFRDPWTDNTFIYFPSARRLAVDQRLERACLDRADAVISVTEPWVEGLRRKAGQPDKPFVLIPNGWDRDDFPDQSAPGEAPPPSGGEEGVIVLRHPGSTYQGEALPLLRALEQLPPAVTQRLRFHLIGHLHPQDRAEIEQSPHAGCFLLSPQRVSHPEALRLMRDAHVLLLLLRKGPDASSGKIFEYMMAGRPVLAIGAKEGVAAQLVRACGIGCAVDAEDAGELAHLLTWLATEYSAFVNKYYRPAWAEIERMERRRLTGELAQLLDEVVTTRAHSK